MSEEKIPDEERIQDHEYDGIHELDNPLPKWWLTTFYLTIIFSLIYFSYYILGSGPGLSEEFQQTLAKLESQTPQKTQNVWPDMALLEAISKNPEHLQKGKTIFQSKCVACHGSQGQGVIGPNLTDAYWIHGKGTLGDIAKVVHDGVNDKGMPPWGTLLKDEEIYEVVSYVKSLKGTQPPNPQAPQGEKVE